jgi:oxysterol-binding protein-related protein 9/10/11
MDCHRHLSSGILTRLEICKRQALQTLQLCTWRILQGEFFSLDPIIAGLIEQCHWDIRDDAPPVLKSSATAAQPAADNQDDPTSPLPPSSEEVRVSYLTEQTSHHPPVSAFFVDCPARGVSARGFDQLSAKFTGTTIRVTPGAHNLGIFINLAQRDNEEYQLTHPAAQLGGILRGALSISVSDVCFVTCPKTRIKVILHYIEEGWLGKSQNRVQGVMFRYDPANDKYSRIKDVPPKDILVNIEGCWQEQVYYSIPSTAAAKNARDGEASSKELLVDLSPMLPIPKIVPPEEDQLPTESRRFWKDVTNAILNKQYGEATRLKQALEQRQRDKAEERKAKKEEWQPKFFTGAVIPKGRPELNEKGQAVLRGIHEGSCKVNDAGDTWA